MEVSKSSVKTCFSWLFLGLFAFLAFQASFADAETHYHQFVVCLSYSQSLYYIHSHLLETGFKAFMLCSYSFLFLLAMKF